MKVVLNLAKPKEIILHQSQNSFALIESKSPDIINKHQFQHEVNENSIFALVVLIFANQPSIESTSSEVHELLLKYQDGCPEEFPSGLPLSRCIQNAIKLVHGALLVNLPHHQMNLDEHAELR